MKRLLTVFNELWVASVLPLLCFLQFSLFDKAIAAIAVVIYLFCGICLALIAALLERSNPYSQVWTIGERLILIGAWPACWLFCLSTQNGRNAVFGSWRRSRDSDRSPEADNPYQSPADF